MGKAREYDGETRRSVAVGTIEQDLPGTIFDEQSNGFSSIHGKGIQPYKRAKKCICFDFSGRVQLIRDNRNNW